MPQSMPTARHVPHRSPNFSPICCDSPSKFRRKLNHYARPSLLCIDEVGLLSYDSSAADLLYEIVAHIGCRSILITTNKAFKDWNTVFPNATSIATLLDRLTHHADITLIEGQSYVCAKVKWKTPPERKIVIASADSYVRLIHGTYLKLPSRPNGSTTPTVSWQPGHRRQFLWIVRSAFVLAAARTRRARA